MILNNLFEFILAIDINFKNNIYTSNISKGIITQIINIFMSQRSQTVVIYLFISKKKTI
ncbi:MAG: hypothetical protein Terrestrivirus2_21 [Terrestrivirus sp.]|uniref:Uncharacterized protein n=1 Tax=Terrestrivirus sp. TaxID=2487775 RepID=A0A3G4ZPI3_9VIRU|nr:MAG: hypothetical protein Terrestrivirus2_21 [Terrestrivirus sp.]